MRIEIFSLCAVGADDIRVTFLLTQGEKECRESFVISAEAYTAIGIRKGESDMQTYERVELESKVYDAFKRGVASLGHGFCSANMLVGKLRTKGFSANAASLAVDRIVERGYLDETENAKREAEKCAAKLWGESRIRAKLYEKRYAKDAIDSALFHLEDSGVDFDENCKKLIDMRYRLIPDDADGKRKLIGAICRQGYSVSQIKSACIALRNKKRDSIL